MTRRRITQDKAIAVADWLRSKQQWIEDNSVESPEVAAIVSKDLGFPIADSTIVRLAHTLRIRFKRSRAVSGIERPDQVRLLAHAVAELFDRLGEPHPEPLAQLLNGHASSSLHMD